MARTLLSGPRRDRRRSGPVRAGRLQSVMLSRAIFDSTEVPNAMPKNLPILAATLLPAPGDARL